MRKLDRHAARLGLAATCLVTFSLAASAGETTRVSVSSAEAQANSNSGVGTISADGRFVAFSSSATNLVPGDTNVVDDVFVRDRRPGAAASQ